MVGCRGGHLFPSGSFGQGREASTESSHLNNIHVLGTNLHGVFVVISNEAVRFSCQRITVLVQSDQDIHLSSKGGPRDRAREMSQCLHCALYFALIAY